MLADFNSILNLVTDEGTSEKKVKKNDLNFIILRDNIIYIYISKE